MENPQEYLALTYYILRRPAAARFFRVRLSFASAF